MTLRLNLGCGRNPIDGWTNIDAVALPGVDVVADLDRCREAPLPFAESSAGEFLLAHVLEHLADPLGLMQELHRIASPGAVATIRCPYGSSDDADEDPTHRRRLFVGSFGYFSQPYYWRADYGYRGDWQPEKVVLRVGAADFAGLSVQELWIKSRRERNWIREMVVTLRAVKPIREPRRELQVQPTVEIVSVP